MAQIRLLLDEDTRILLAPSLRDAGYDAKHVLEVGMSRADDPDVLAFAASQGRVVFSHNAKGFMLLSEEYTRTRRFHPGILLAGQAKFSELRHRLLRFLRKTTAEELAGLARWLP